MFQRTALYKRSARIAALLGTASITALASTVAQAADQATQTPAEEVLITGSLIRGTSAVGVPVTALGAEDFRQTGSLTVTDLLRNTPALQVQQDTSPSQGGGRLSGVVNVQIHGLGTGAGNEALLMVNGLRIPPQNYSLDTMDPSIIPQIAVERVDVLTAGASATYGSDATAGVINVILRRNFEGAITQASYRTSTDIRSDNFQIAQLYGRTWDTGGVTVSYQFTENQKFLARERSYYTTNFEPYGLHDHTPLASSMPGVVTTGSRATAAGAPPGVSATLGTRYCSNCFALPRGIGWNYGDTPEHTNPTAPGSAPTTTWAAIQAGAFVPFAANTQNQTNVWKYADGGPQRQSNQATLTFDQKLTSDFLGLGAVSIFVDAFYSNRRSKIVWQANGGDAREALIANATVPTNNPYYPTGAPAGLRVNYFLGAEIPQTVVGGEIAGRWNTGFNFDDIGFGWAARLTYSKTEIQAFGLTPTSINLNNVRAALGQTVASQAARGTIPGQAAYIKPASIPFLNPFCDADLYRCIAPATADYITGFRDQRSRYQIQQWAVNMDGPLFELPGGMLRGGVVLESTGHSFLYREAQNFRNHSTALISDDINPYTERVWAAAAQINIPVFGEDYSFPLVQSFEIEAGYRYDHYTTLETDVWTPKVSANWNVGWGLLLRGSWGTAFRAPNPGEENGPLFTALNTLNVLGGQTENTQLLNCAPFIGSTGLPTTPGGAPLDSLTAALNPTCSTAPAFIAPAGVDVGGGGTGAAEILRGHGLEPQTVDQWFVGFAFAPTEGLLEGLNVDAQYFVLRFDGLIGNGFPGEGPNDPRSFERYTVIPNPSAPITDSSNAAFLDLVNQLASVRTRGGEGGIPPGILPDIKFIRDTANSNIGWRKIQGIDFNGRYDWDMGNWGAWHVGISGYYEVDNRQQNTPTSAITETYEGRHSGNRLQRVRYRLGWTDGEWNVVGFARYTGHGAFNTSGQASLPTCFYQATFGPGSCYPGSPYYGPTITFPNFSPAVVEFDLTVGYETGDRPDNPHLRNLGFQLAINNILNRRPPFQIGTRGSGQRDGRAFDNSFSDQQRVVAFTVTKAW